MRLQRFKLKQPPPVMRFQAILIFSLCLLKADLLAQENTQEPERPDIILMLADDLGFGDWSPGDGLARTPNMEQLCNEGVRLNRYYTYPLCTPTRVSLMSGTSPARFGMIFSPLRPWDQRSLPQGVETLPEKLREVGYRTALVGKWHLGHTKAWMHPNQRGFDYFYGFVTGAIDYISHLSRNGGLDWQRNGESLREKGYSTTLFGNDAANWIRTTSKNEPYFLYLPFNAPHTPIQAPKEFTEHYADTTEDINQRIYYGMVEAMDAAIGDVLQAVEERGNRDNTLILFLSDNGGATKYGASNAPLRAGKGTTFEGSIRVPGVVSWPNRLPKGLVSEQLFMVLDWFPTLLAAAHAPVAKNPDGLNRLPQLLQKEAKPTAPREDLFFATCTGKAISYAMIRWPWKRIQRVIRGTEVTRNFLYRLDLDPSEANNLNATETEQSEVMRLAIQKWMDIHPDGTNFFAPPGCLSQSAPEGWVPPEKWTDLSGMTFVPAPKENPSALRKAGD